jgi:hypothetical protein
MGLVNVFQILTVLKVICFTLFQPERTLDFFFSEKNKGHWIEFTCRHDFDSPVKKTRTYLCVWVNFFAVNFFNSNKMLLM